MTLKFGLRGHDLGQRTPASLAADLRAYGYDCVQFVPHKILKDFGGPDDPLSPADIAALKAGLKAADFELALVGCYRDLANPEQYDYNLGAYPKLGRLAHELGCQYVGTESSLLALKAEQITARKDCLLDIAPKIAALLAKEQVTMLLEPVRLQPLCSPELCDELVKRIGADHVKFIFDACSLLLDAELEHQEQVWENWFAHASIFENTVVFHAKDFVYNDDGTRRMCPLGRGLMRYELIKPYLNQLPNLKYVIREWQDPAFVNEDLAFMKGLFA